MDRDRELLRADFEDRRQLLEFLVGQSKMLDQWLMSLSAGAFGLSVLFLGTFENETQPANVWALLLAWAAFGACLSIRLVTFKTSVKTVKEQIAFIDDRIQGIKRQEIEQSQGKERWWLPRLWTRYLSYASMLMFFAGATLIGYFAITNL